MSNVSCKLQDPFPVECLPTINLGSMDGHRDSLIEKGFVVTKSISKFLTDKHSIIIGPFGSGKSALFNLLRNKSEELKVYSEDFIVTIDEQLQFNELKKLSEVCFPNLSEKLTFQLIWKFQVCRRISEEFLKLEDFPKNENEKYINNFLARSGGVGGHLSIISRIKGLFDKVSLTVKVKISEVPIDIEFSNGVEKTAKRVELNLDEVIQKATSIIEERGIRRCIVAIDKLDKFVAGEEYETQRSYIEALLQLEDDLYGINKIGFKIFLRSDLYDRLDFSALGPDKAEDNTLRLVWSKEEIRSFIAKRMYIAFSEAGLWTFKDIIESSDMSEYRLRWYEKIIINDGRKGFKYKIASYYNKMLGRKRNKTTLFGKIDLIVINKLFEKNLVHECSDGNEQTILNYEFFDTHFLDGNDSCTPRYILVFLKELLDEASYYYSNSPDVYVTPTLNDGSWIYNLFSHRLVYKAYLQSKEKYIRHVSKVDDRWTRHIIEFLEKQGGKTIFDYKWVQRNITFEESSVEVDQQVFIIYLQVIGFLKVRSYHRDIKKRHFEIPVLYKAAKGFVDY